jgi:uncharacterized protein YbjQ (UPF0145 family)
MDAMDAESASVAVTLLFYVGLPALVLFVGWLVGHLSETRHERSLAEREEALRDIEATDMRNPPGFAAAEGPCMLVSGEAVVASDTFKSWVFGLKNIVGGESKFFTRLFERARREALLRMKTRARELGCNAVCNVRFDSADIGGNASGMKKKGSNMAVALVSGTAWRRPAVA